MAGAGIEPATLALWVLRSNQLSYPAIWPITDYEPIASATESIQPTCARQDLNLQPLGPKPSTLSSWATGANNTPSFKDWFRPQIGRALLSFSFQSLFQVVAGFEFRYLNGRDGDSLIRFLRIDAAARIADAR